MVELEQYRLSPEQLRWRCEPGCFRFQRTDEVLPQQEFIGQSRAMGALDFGLGMDKPGYNIFVTGLTGTGKSSAIKAYLQRAIEARHSREARFYPDDWCYVHNFVDPDIPRAIRFPRGRGRALRSALEALLATFKTEIPRAFSSEEYSRERKELTESAQKQQQELLQGLNQRAQESGFAVQVAPVGVALLPFKEGRPMTQQEFLTLSPEERQSLESVQGQVMKEVEATFENIRALEREAEEKVRGLDNRVGLAAISSHFQKLVQEYQDVPDAAKFLEELKAFTLENLDLFRQNEHRPPTPLEFPFPRTRERDPLLAYQVNLFVDNSATEGPPIVIETNPNFGNLFGKLERRAFLGTYLVDHTMLKPGAIHRANGGYLILNARDLFISPGVWEGLKRLIRTKEARVEDPLEYLGMFSTQGLRPQPIPVDVKVVITGDPMVYRLLSTLDEDFWEMFKVKADFDYQIERSPENLDAYAGFIAACCQQEELLHFDPSGVALVVEHAARVVADQGKLSTRFGMLKDVIVEADYWCRRDGATVITQEHVHRAIDEKVYRSNLVEERLRQLIVEGTLMVDVDGEAVGQVNGLAVYDLGDFSFGKPSRITARTFMGRRGVINIERESQLSGRIHDKGVLILSSYLGHKYAQDKPLTLSASVCFEQSYEGIEGDSASSTELYAILSSLSGLPVRQDIAITGSVNQNGDIQAIGGVNQKIEGFYQVCQAKGFTGRQGVIIPHQNVRNLMLREEVVEAVKEGKFHIYAVKSIDQGIEVLTATPAGEKGPDGAYPEGSVTHLVDKRLRELAQGLRGFAGDGPRGDGEGDGTA
jgi:lon-related putative ATP-dependent protease